MINELTFFINKIKIIKYYFHNHLLKYKFKSRFNQIRLFQKPIFQFSSNYS